LQDTLKPLHYAVHLRSVAKYLGSLALMLACLALGPLIVSLWFGDYELSKRYLLVIAFLVIAGLPSLRLKHPADLQQNESLTITALAFIITPLIMSYPMMGAGLGFIDAWFEAVSAITTTGLSTVANVEQMPHTLRFARAWMQWYGGLGIVVLSVAILLNHHIALRRLITPGAEGMITTTRVYARRVFGVYIVLTLLGFVILYLLVGDAFNALAYTLASVSTGGFSPLNNSLGDLPWQVQYGVTLLGLCGAIPFILYYRLSHGDWREIVKDIEVRTLLGITLLVCLLMSMSFMYQSGMNWQQAVHQGTLLGISAQTTTGFSSLDVGGLDGFSMVLVILVMVVGGTVGSTAGGFKILRLLILWQLIRLLIRRTAVPTHAVVEPRLGDKTLESEDIERALMLIILFVIVIVLSWLIFLAYGYDPLRSLFEVTSATGTVGLSSGLASHELEPVLKGVLCIDMLLGRVEIIALLVVLYPGTWLGKRSE